MTEELYHLGVKALIRNEQGEVLLFETNPAKLQGGAGYWDLPGGRVQKDDTVEETLRREVAEETGIMDLEIIRNLGMSLSNIRIPVAGESMGLILSVYECGVSPIAEITISDEHVGFEWIVPARAAELLKVKYPLDFCQLVARLA